MTREVDTPLKLYVNFQKKKKKSQKEFERKINQSHHFQKQVSVQNNNFKKIFLL